MKVILSDDKKSISIETPAGNKLSLIEKGSGIVMRDQNGNKITIAPSGITGESSNDMVLKINTGKILIKDAAGNQVKIEPTGVTVHSATKVIISGATVELNAAQITVNAGMTRFNGVVQATTLIATTGVISPSYTPGAGNIM